MKIKSYKDLSSKLNTMIKKGYLSGYSVSDELTKGTDGNYYTLFTFSLEGVALGEYEVLGIAKRSVNGWIKVSFTDDNINFIDDDICDHCSTTRKRNTYFILNRDNKIVKIGSTCIEAYTGFKCSSLINLMYTDWMSDEYRESFIPTIEIETLFEAVYTATNNFKTWEKGWSATVVKNVISNPVEFDEIHRYNDNDKELIDLVKTAIESLKVDNDFNNNVKSSFLSIGGVTEIDYRNLGAIAYFMYKVIKDHYQDIAKMKNKAAFEETTNSEYLGEEGTRLNFNATIIKVIGIESIYGYSNLMILNSNGNLVKWFDNKCQFDNDDLGKELTLKGTIKSTRIDDYSKEQKVTFVNRVKVL